MAVRQDASTGQLIDDGGTPAIDTPVLKQSGRPTLHVKVYSPFRTYYDDHAFSLSAINTTGPFDILPQHHNFISLLEACELTLDTPSGPQKIKIAGGILHMHANDARILLDV
jgi:F0F1-type ATP synthase epsilon subunit